MIVLIPIGGVALATLEALRQPLAEVFRQGTQVGERIGLPSESWDEQRGQHLASVLLALIPLPEAGNRALGVVDVDIFAYGLNFVFGEADIVGKRALISLCRLRQEFYGLSADEKLFGERMVKEVIHELGHTYGLGHCQEPTCVMYFSNSLLDTDLKGKDFCPECERKVSR
jgi:archaemetzincin